MAVTGVAKFARENAGAAVVEVARASNLASNVVGRIEDANGNKSVDRFEVVKALAGESPEMKALVMAAYNGAKKAAADKGTTTLKRWDVQRALIDGTSKVAKLDTNHNGRLARAELEKVDAWTPLHLVRLAAALDDVTPGKMSTAKLGQAVAKIMDGVNIISESDSPVTFVSTRKNAGLPITSENVLSAFESHIAKAFDGSDLDSGLAAEIATPATTRRWFAGMTQPDTDDPSSDYNVAAAAFKKLKPLFDANLKDLRHVKIGPKADDGTLATDQGMYVELFVGKTADGRLAGVSYTVVET